METFAARRDLTSARPTSLVGRRSSDSRISSPLRNANRTARASDSARSSDEAPLSTRRTRPYSRGSEICSRTSSSSSKAARVHRNKGPGGSHVCTASTISAASPMSRCKFASVRTWLRPPGLNAVRPIVRTNSVSRLRRFVWYSTRFESPRLARASFSMSRQKIEAEGSPSLTSDMERRVKAKSAALARSDRSLSSRGILPHVQRVGSRISADWTGGVGCMVAPIVAAIRTRNWVGIGIALGFHSTNSSEAPEPIRTLARTVGSGPGSSFDSVRTVAVAEEGENDSTRTPARRAARSSACQMSISGNRLLNRTRSTHGCPIHEAATSETSGSRRSYVHKAHRARSSACWGRSESTWLRASEGRPSIGTAVFT